MKLRLLETWSKRYTGNLDFDLPNDWQLATHQQEVYEALHNPDIDIVFDTAMTGDGKSLAAYLPMLRPNSKALGNGLFAYPTNELIRDQERQVKDYLENFDTSLEYQQLNGSAISNLANEHDLTRYDAIKDLVYRQNVLLTNPDIFNLIHSFAYTSDINPATLSQQLANQYRYIVFDEFHIFSATQIATVLDALLFIRANSSKSFPTKFLFLSATPSSILQDALDRADFRYKIIEGNYKHGAKPEGEYRSILQEAMLEIEACDASSGGVLAWVENNIENIRKFFDEETDSKGLIICNSVFTAKKVFALLEDLLANDDISLGENTGLTGQEGKNKSLDQDLVVATSTVDVGVDFTINLLIFESLNAGTFIQRLGRLGRHRRFSRYKAIALLPEFIVERFTKNFEDNQTIDRESLFAKVKGEDGSKREEKIFLEEQAFERYVSRWGGVKVVQRLAKLYKYGGREKHETLIKLYQPKALKVFKVTPITKARARNLSAALNEELWAFRGAGLTDVWAYDPSSKAITSIDVIRLLGGADFKLIPRKEAEEISNRLGVAFYPPKLNLFAIIHGYHDEFQKVELCYRESFKYDTESFNVAAERIGFWIEAQHPDILKVSDALESAPLCTCVTEEDSSSLKRKLKLPPLFSVSKVRDDSGAVYSVAFGHDALLLDSLIHFRKTNNFDIV